MKALGIIFIYLFMAAAIGAGILMAMKGTFWLLIVAILGFLFAFAKFGCLSA